MMLSNLVVLLTENAVRPSVVLEPCETNVIVGEVSLKVLDRVFLHRLPTLTTHSIAKAIPTVKG